MIDTVYHLGVAMKNEQIDWLADPDDLGAVPGAKPRWSPAVTELLDHLARELAEEYVSLMEQAAAEEDLAADESEREGE
jgi:hypothetical protein